jgi:hypothetical protein
MWNTVLSLCLLTTTGGTPKSPDARILTAIKRVTTAAQLLHGKVILSFVKPDMPLNQGLEILAECPQVFVDRARLVGATKWGEINGQVEVRSVVWAIYAPTFADIWAALTGGDERRRERQTPSTNLHRPASGAAPPPS